MHVWYSITLATDDWIRRVGKLGDVDLPPLRVLLTRPLPFHLLSPSLSAVAFASVIYVNCSNRTEIENPFGLETRCQAQIGN